MTDLLKKIKNDSVTFEKIRNLFYIWSSVIYSGNNEIIELLNISSKHYYEMELFEALNGLHFEISCIGDKYQLEEEYFYNLTLEERIEKVKENYANILDFFEYLKNIISKYSNLTNQDFNSSYFQVDYRVKEFCEKTKVMNEKLDEIINNLDFSWEKYSDVESYQILVPKNLPILLASLPDDKRDSVNTNWKESMLFLYRKSNITILDYISGLGKMAPTLEKYEKEIIEKIGEKVKKKIFENLNWLVRHDHSQEEIYVHYNISEEKEHLKLLELTRNLVFYALICITT